MITSLTSIFKSKLKLESVLLQIWKLEKNLKIGFNAKKNAYTMNFWEGIKEEFLKFSASECESFIYLLKFWKKKTSRIWGRGGRIHTLTSTPFARLVVKSEGGGGVGYSWVNYYLTALYITSLSRTLPEPVASRRALYGYPCPEIPKHDSRGIYRNSDGMLYVK